MKLNITDDKLKAVLLKESYVSDEDILKAEAFAKSNNSSIVDYLLENNLLTNDILGL